jgi:hypothetical protein
MHLFQTLQRANICDTQFSCAECKKAKVDSSRIGSGIVFIQPGFIYKDYKIDDKQTIILFALCRTCCDKYTLTKLRWKWAEWQWQWSQFVWFVMYLLRRHKALK